MKLRSLAALLISVVSLPSLADVGFTSDRYSTVSGNAQVTLKVARDTTGPAITLGYRTVAGTAVPGSDYIDQQSGTVTIPANTSGPADISIPLLFNGNAQTRSFAVELTSTSGDTLSGFVRANVQVLGSADPANSVGVVRLPVTIDAVSTENIYALSISRESGSKGPASVRVLTRGGSGFQPIDRIVSWGDGEAGVKTIPVISEIDFLDRQEAVAVPIELTEITGFTLQGSNSATIYFVSPYLGGVPNEVYFIGLSATLAAATDTLSFPVSIPVDSSDPDSIKGYGFVIRGLSTDVLEGRDFIVAGGNGREIQFDDSGVETISVDFPSESLADRQFEFIFSRYGVQLERRVFTLLGTTNDPYYRTGPNQNPGTYAFFGSETRLTSDAIGLVAYVNRTGASPLLPYTLQYRLTPLTAPSGTDVLTNLEVGTIAWGENEVGAKTITLPLLRRNLVEERRFNLAVFNPAGVKLADQVVVVEGRGNPNRDTIGFVSSQRDFPQDVTSVVAFVERRGTGQGAATVQYRIEDGNTVIGLDYAVEDAIGTLEWDDGELGAKQVVIDVIRRNAFVDKYLVLRLTGTDVTQAASSQQVLITKQPYTVENSGLIELERDLIVTNTNDGSVPVRVLRTGGSQSAVTGLLTVKKGDNIINSQQVSWAVGDSAPKTLNVRVTDVGQMTVELSQVIGALASSKALQIEVEQAGSPGGGGSFSPLALLFLLPAALIRYRRRKKNEHALV